MCSHEPGLFTRTMPAIVIPRKTSSETSRWVSFGIGGHLTTDDTDKKSDFKSALSAVNWIVLRLTPIHNYVRGPITHAKQPGPRPRLRSSSRCLARRWTSPRIAHSISRPGILSPESHKTSYL